MLGTHWQGYLLHHQLGVVAYVLAEKKGGIDATEWLKKVLANFQGELADGCSDLYA